MGDFLLEDHVVETLKKETVNLDKARKLWQDAKATAKNAKTAVMQDLLKAFKGDLGPNLDGMAKIQANMIKAWDAAQKSFKSEKLKVVQTLAGYKAAIKARKLESTPEGAKMLAALETIKNSID